MSGPWTQYQGIGDAPSSEGPWAKYTPKPAIASGEPQTTLGGVEGSFARGLAPVATGAAIGAGVGSIVPGVGTALGAAAGGGAVGLTEMATGLYDRLADQFGWPKTATPQEATDKILDLAGVKRPTTGLERAAQSMAGGVGGAIAPVRAAESIAESAASPVIRGVAEQLAAKPVLQAVSGGTGALAAQSMAEMGLGPGAQFIAGLIGGGLPMLKEIPSTLARAPTTPEARQAVASGYVYPPHELTPLGEKASLLSRTGESEAGKIKLQQEASVRNQINTQKIAAQDIGLPAGTFLDERAFEKARAPAAAVYREVENAIPEVSLSKDSLYQRDVSALGGKNSDVEKFFPELKENPGIIQLRQMMARNENVPTAVAMKTIADLRFTAGINLKAMGNAQKHALGLAQREAADALEGAVERSVKSAPEYFSSKVAEIDTKITEANKAVESAKHSLAVQPKDSPFRAMNEDTLQRVEARASALSKAREDLVHARDLASEKNPQNQTLYDRFKDARQLFAKIYDVEGATNRTTGEVSAAGLARLYNKGKPLSGGLKSIADAYNVSPKALQMPSKFGGAEDWSALDFFGTMAALAHGNVGVAGAIASRPIIRKGLLTPKYQGAATGAVPNVLPMLPLLMNPGASSVVQPQGWDALVGNMQ